MAYQSYEHPLTKSFFDALDEFFNQEEINSLLNKPDRESYDALGSGAGLNIMKILDALIERYRPPQGLGLVVRIGRAAFKCSLQSLDSLEEMKALSFRLLPIQSKMKRCLDIFSDILSPSLVDSVTVIEEDERFLWCFRPIERFSAGHSAWLHGFIQEGLLWASNGKYYPIEEAIENQATGRGHILIIPKRALE